MSCSPTNHLALAAAYATYINISHWLAIFWQDFLKIFFTTDGVTKKEDNKKKFSEKLR
jgi:hypothetical protein